MATWSDIPFDILDKVLAHLVSAGETSDRDHNEKLKDVVNASAVCKTWREHTVNAKRVWAALAGAHKVSPSTYGSILARSGNYPLLISTEVTAKLGTSSLTGYHWDAIRANFHRVRLFDVEFEGEPDQSWLVTLSQPAPSLQGLRLKGNAYSNIEIPSLFANSAPSLRVIHIENLELLNDKVPALSNVAGVHYFLPRIDDDDLKHEDCIGLLRNTPSVEFVSIGNFRFPSGDFDDDEQCYQPFEAVPPIPLHRAKHVRIAGDLLGATAALIRLDLPLSCRYRFEFTVDECPRDGHVTNAGHETFTRLDRIWAGKIYSGLRLTLCRAFVRLDMCGADGVFGDSLKMEMTRWDPSQGDYFEPFGLSDFAGFLAYISRQRHFQKMAGEVKELDLVFQINSEDFPDIPYEYLQEFFAVFPQVVHVKASGGTVLFLTDHERMMKTNIPNVYQPPFPALQRLNIVNVHPQWVPEVKRHLQSLLELRQQVIPNCPPLHVYCTERADFH